ncbi:MAG: glycogen synthase GlgA [Proteobacteria bacterium]|nr:glycogen synthase GlgA [Pseudomonadota bacterium]
MKKILMVTSEAIPFAKTGGLAEVVSELAVHLSELGNDVRILMPRYYHIDRGTLRKADEALGIRLKDNEKWTAVYEGRLPDSDIPVYFLDHEQYYGREGIYGPRPDEGFEDNVARFALLSRGAFQLCRMLHWIPDVMHCHDWTAAPVCYLLKKEEHSREFAATQSVMTIHNLGYQGIFSLDDAAYLQKETDWLALSALEFSGALNFLKAGIMSADQITTVSPNYAEEIKRPEHGFGLDGLLKYRHEDLTGILNGIDYSVWNPEVDKYIKPHHYSAESMGNKNHVKKRLQKEMELPVNADVPLVGMVSRLAEQKGFRALCGPDHGSLYAICRDRNVQFVILGSGEKWCEDELVGLERELPNLGVRIGYDERLSHLIEAGSDFFLMPSIYEPCGLNQLYSLSYGTLPIVRHTGGLADTVQNYDQKKGTGTGFVFHDLNPDVLYNVLGWVVETWEKRKNHICKMRTTAMKQRFTWEKSALEYLDVYKKAGA